MRFIADCMLGKLAKWLKVLGFDVLYMNKAEDDELLQLARREKRLLLTKDHELLEKAKARGLENYFVQSDDWRVQVGQDVDGLSLREKIRPYSRCLECNAEFKSLPKKKAKNLVAPFVYERARSFAICPRCGRVFWQGTHFRDMEFKVEEILNRPSHRSCLEPAVVAEKKGRRKLGRKKKANKMQDNL